MIDALDVGLIVRKDFNELVVEQGGDYHFFAYMKGVVGSFSWYTPDTIDELKQHDTTILYNFPFNRSFCEKLSDKEVSHNIINKPSGIIATSEKTFELENLSKYLPETVLLSESTYGDAVQLTKKGAVVKPVNGTGGEGIKPVLEAELDHYLDQSVLVQENVKNDGNIRAICFNGKIMGSALYHNPDAFVNNVASGGTITPFDLTSPQEKMVLDIADKLISLGVLYVGVDVINGPEAKIFEVNTAAPGGMIDGADPFNGAYKFISELNSWCLNGGWNS